MMKIIETALIWACLPFVALAVLAGLINATWTTIGVILLVLASPAIAGFLYGVIVGNAEWNEREAKRKARDAEAARQEIRRAYLPGRPDDVILSAPAENMPAPAQSPAAPAAESAFKQPFGNQWRA